MKTVIPKRAGASNPYLDRIKLVKGDITRQKVDAVVSVIPQTLEYRGSLNTKLLKEAGQELDKFMLEHVYRPRPGDVYAVPGFGLPCEYIIFSILSARRSDFDREDRDLLQACRKAMEMATGMGLDAVAFPPIVSGKNGFPKERAARLIVQGIVERLGESIKEVRIVCSDKETHRIFKERIDIEKRD